MLAGAIDAREGLHGQLFGCGRIADDAQNPAVDRALMLAEERLKGVEIAIAEPLQHGAGHRAGAVGHPSSLSIQAYGRFGRKVTSVQWLVVSGQWLVLSS